MRYSDVKLVQSPGQGFNYSYQFLFDTWVGVVLDLSSERFAFCFSGGSAREYCCGGAAAKLWYTSNRSHAKLRRSSCLRQQPQSSTIVDEVILFSWLQGQQSAICTTVLAYRHGQLFPGLVSKWDLRSLMMHTESSIEPRYSMMIVRGWRTQHQIA